MNINLMMKPTVTSRLCDNTFDGDGKTLLSEYKSKMMYVGIKTLDVVKWVLRPESENDYPQFTSKKINSIANFTKILFWIGIAIGTGLLIAQLSS